LIESEKQSKKIVSSKLKVKLSFKSIRRNIVPILKLLVVEYVLCKYC